MKKILILLIAILSLNCPAQIAFPLEKLWETRPSLSELSENNKDLNITGRPENIFIVEYIVKNTTQYNKVVFIYLNDNLVSYTIYYKIDALLQLEACFGKSESFKDSYCLWHNEVKNISVFYDIYGFYATIGLSNEYCLENKQ